MSDLVAGPRHTVAALLPIRTWLRAAPMRKAHVLFFAALVGFPLLGTWLYHQQFQPYVSSGGSIVVGPLLHDLKWMDWQFVGYFGVVWLVALRLIIRPKVTVASATVVTGLSLLGSFSIALWLEKILHADTANFFSAVFAIGGSEEFAKIIPVLAAMILLGKVKSSRFRGILDLDPKSFLYLGTLSGVVFGCKEAVGFITQAQEANLVHHSDAFGLTFTVFYRLVTDPINHAMWAGTTAFFVGLAVQRARRAGRLNPSGLLRQAWLVGVGLALTATLHGLHDFAGNYLVDVVIDVTSVLLMLAYARAGDVVEQAVGQLPKSQWGARLRSAANYTPQAAPAPDYRHPYQPHPYPAPPHGYAAPPAMAAYAYPAAPPAYAAQPPAPAAPHHPGHYLAAPASAYEQPTLVPQA